MATTAATKVTTVERAAPGGAGHAPIWVSLPVKEAHVISAMPKAVDGPGNAYHVTAPHHRVTKNKEVGGQVDYTLSHAIYTKEEAESVGNNLTHYPEQNVKDKAAIAVLKVIRTSFDLATNYGHNMTASKYLTRMIVLETVAGIPGMVGAMWRHFRSLRTMKRDGGRIHTLLEEAENERMHLLTFMELKKPGLAVRGTVLLAQGLVTNLYSLAYALSPSACHRFVGYLEEEAVKTYTKCIADLDAGKLPEWSDMPAPEIGVRYWRLAPDAKMRDLLLAVRADEAIHRDVNHVFADLKADQPNPFV
jgi:threonyl-tRNA synthetase